VEARPGAPRDEEQLQFYLRNARHREMYAEEIVALVQKNRSLETLEFIPLSFWYDAPLISRDSDRRHDHG
jgi:hypothetical protein